jgi:hypothetical protein
VDSERSGDEQEINDGGISMPVFDHADVICVNLSGLGEILLRHPGVAP